MTYKSFINNTTFCHYAYDSMDEITVGSMNEMLDELYDGSYIALRFWVKEYTRCDIIAHYTMDKLIVNLCYYDEKTDDKLNEYNFKHDGCSLIDIAWMLTMAELD